LFTTGLENLLIEHDEKQFVEAWNILKRNANLSSFHLYTEEDNEEEEL